MNVNKPGAQRFNLLAVFTLLVVVFASFSFAFDDRLSQFVLTAAVYAGVFIAYRHKVFSLKSIGLGRGSLFRGVKPSLILGCAIAAVMVAVYLIAPDYFQDERYRNSAVSATLQVIVVLPFFTILLEELLFRGVMPCILSKDFNQTKANVFSALLFGLWHVLSSTYLPAISVPLLGELPNLIGSICVVLATGLFGYVLIWLRYRYDSLLVPVIVHWVINGAGVVLAYLAWNLG